MIFQRTYRNILLRSPKYNALANRYLPRFFCSRISLISFKKYSRYSNAIFASAAAIGLSVFIAHSRYTNCENLEVDDFKDSNLTNVCDNIYDEAIIKSRDLLQRIKDEVGAPGMVVGVSINGKTVWTEGIGYSDVENRVQCSSDTVMRIASISKSITMAAVAKLWEQGKLDLDKPIQDYVPYFPPKSFNGKPVTITCRQLVSHLGGIRHYEKNSNSGAQKKNEKDVSDENNKRKKAEFENEEYYLKENFKDVKSSIDLFKDDPLIASPGLKYHYSTHGWTLISAVVEAASKEQFCTHMTKLFKSLGMSSTYLDVNDTLIYNRSRYYMKDKRGRLINAPFVDNSYKWAGGGFLSTVGDLLQFGNSMLYSLQFKPSLFTENVDNVLSQNVENIEKNIQSAHSQEIKKINSDSKILPGYLSSKTVEAMWTPAADGKKEKYGMGWFIFPEVQACQFCENKKFSVYHTGGAIGASSILLILPQKKDEINDLNQTGLPQGIVVAIITNLQSVGLSQTASKIAEIFDSHLKH